MNEIKAEAGERFAELAAVAREEEEKSERLRQSCVEGSVFSFFRSLLSTSYIKMSHLTSLTRLAD